MCLSVILEFCLLYVVCLSSTAYTDLCRGQKYLLKVRYIILNYPNVARFLILRLFVWTGQKHDVCLKKNHKNERHLGLVTHSFTKLSQNVCLIKTHILIYWHAKYIRKLWKALRFFCVFRVFSYITL